MGGNATFSGTNYQAAVIAYVAAHILAQRDLSWFYPDEAIPTAVSGETGGPGDDARIEFGGKRAPVELQAKHGCDRAAVIETVRRVHQRGSGDPSDQIVLAVDGSTPTWIRSTLPAEIARLRSGSDAKLRIKTKELLTALSQGGVPTSALASVRIQVVDGEEPGGAGPARAMDLLRTVVIVDPVDAAAAWSLLLTEAARVCAQRERRSRTDLVKLLEGAHIKVRPPEKDDPWLQRLDFTKELLARDHNNAALGQLNQIETTLNASSDAHEVGTAVWYRLAVLRAQAFLQAEKFSQSLLNAKKALDLDPDGLSALVVASYAAASSGDASTASQYANRATDAHPQEESAWGARAYVAEIQSATVPTPPPSVVEGKVYRRVLLQIASSRRDAKESLRLSTSLLASNERSSWVLFARSNALIDASLGTSGMDDRERYDEVERLTTEIIDALEDEAHRLVVKAYVLRGHARRKLGRRSEGEEDNTAALRIKPDDEDAIKAEAMWRVADGNYGRALVALQHPVVSAIPELLAIRARVHSSLDD